TLADDRLEAFYDNPNALRDYFRDIGRMVLAAEGRKANDSHADCYQYFCVPEYGTANGRLHFHAVHFMRTLPTGSVDPNFGRRVRNRRQLNSLQNTWPYGYSMPIAVRYTQDAFSRSGWLWPLMLKVSRLKLPVIWLLVSMWLNTLTKSQRSEERRVGKECRSRRKPYQQKKKQRTTTRATNTTTHNSEPRNMKQDTHNARSHRPDA